MKTAIMVKLITYWFEQLDIKILTMFACFNIPKLKTAENSSYLLCLGVF